MRRMRLWVGLDVGADDMAVCCTDDDGNTRFECSIPAKAAALDDVLRSQKRRIKRIGLEAGSCGVLLARTLRQLGYRVAVFEARKASKFLAIRKNKTDKNDAKGLAEVARLAGPSVTQVLVKSPACQRLRSKLVTRRRLVRVRSSLEASMRSLFRLNGGRLKAAHSASALRTNVSNELARMQTLKLVDLTDEVRPLLVLSEAARNFIEDLERELQDIAEHHPVCRRFLDIPGVGPICALSFYSAVEDPTRFRRNADVGAYFGLTPTIRQSGQSTAGLHISKTGDGMTRSYLAQAALSHVRYGNSPLTAWGAQLSERRGKGRAQIAVARKLAVMMMAMWRSGEPYDPKRNVRAAEGSASDAHLLTAK